MTKWMVVYTTDNLPDAHIVAGRLEHEGIPALVDYLAGRSAIGLTIGVWGEVRVVVHPDHYNDALSILYPEQPELPDGIDDDDIIDGELADE